MTVRLLHISDIENVYDDYTRIGRLAGAVRSLRDDSTLVVGTGDNVAPCTLALFEEGHHSVDLFDALELDVSTFGNHDFDYGQEAIREIADETPQEWISTNLQDPPGRNSNDDSEDAEGDRPRGTDSDTFAGVSRSTVREVDGVTVGFVAATDPESSIPYYIPASDPVESIERAVGEIRSRVDVVVALAHLNHAQTIAVGALDDVDVVCGGHVHDRHRELVDGTLVVRPRVNGDGIWEVPLGNGGFTGEPEYHEISRYAPAAPIVKQYREKHKRAGLTDRVGAVEESLDRSKSARFRHDSLAGKLVAEAYRWGVDGDVGCVDSGAIRDGPELDGSVTAGDLIGLVPFPGRLHAAEISGRELRRLVEDIVIPGEDRDLGDEAVAFTAQLSGLRVTVDRRTRSIHDLEVGGEAVVEDETYTVGTSTYVIDQSERFPAVTRDQVVDSHGPEYEFVVEYLDATGVFPGEESYRVFFDADE